MMAFYEALLYRVKEDPISRLGRCDVRLLNPYRVGYDFARRDWGLPSLERIIDLDKFRAWQSSKVHLCSQNLESFCRLLTDTDEDAFELFFLLYDSAFKENGIATPIAAFESEKVDTRSVNKSGSILSLITDPAFPAGDVLWERQLDPVAMDDVQWLRPRRGRYRDIELR